MHRSFSASPSAASLQIVITWTVAAVVSVLISDLTAICVFPVKKLLIATTIAINFLLSLCSSQGMRAVLSNFDFVSLDKFSTTSNSVPTLF